MKKGGLIFLLVLILSLCACTQAPVAVTPVAPLSQEVEQPSETEATPMTLPEETPDLPAKELMPETPVEQEQQNTCTLSVRCDTIWKNPNRLDETLLTQLPEDGVVYPEQTISFTPGESVFDLLKRELTQKAIHFEFSIAPLYQSAYIEGIANLYEFDCGNLSGWMYTVNGQVPGVGVSACQIAPGDVILLWYTCDLGEDLP